MADRPLRHRHHRQRRRRRHARLEAGADRQADPAARAGRLPPAGARQLGHRRRVPPWQVHDERDLEGRRRPRASRRSRTTTSAATRSSTAPRCSVSGPRTSASIKHHGGVSPAWPLDYKDFEPWYAEAEQLYVVHGKAGEDPTDGPRSSEYPYPAVKHEPAHPEAERRPREARTAPVAPPDRRHARPGRRRRRRCTPAAASVVIGSTGSACLVDAQGRRADRLRRPGARAPATSSWSPTPRSSGSRPTPPAGQVTAVVATMADGSEARFSGDVVVVVVRCAELRAALAAVGQRRAPERASPTGRTRSAATTCATTTWR